MVKWHIYVSVMKRLEVKFQSVARFNEHPAWTNQNVPGEFTIVAYKGE